MMSAFAMAVPFIPCLRSSVPAARAALIALVCVGLLLAPVTLHETGRAFRAWWDFSHVPALAIITGCLLAAGRHVRIADRGLLAAWLAMLLLPPALEGLQGFSAGREQHLADIAYGWAGCLIGGLWFTGQGAARRLAGLAALLAAGYPAAITLDAARVHRMFPVLSSFDSPLEATRWRIHGCDVRQTDGWDITICDEVAYPGVILDDERRNWSAATDLCVSAFLPGSEPLDMTVVIDDAPGIQAYDNRFQRRFTLRPGSNLIRIERAWFGFTTGGRPMNLQAIAGLGLYFNRDDAGRRVRLHDVFLTMPDDTPPAIRAEP